MTTPSELADELEALAKSADEGSWDARAKAGASLRNRLFVSIPTILFALRRVEKMEAALAEHDAMTATLPCEKSGPMPAVCPRCGSESDEGCGPRASIDYKFSERIRQALTGEAQ